MAIPLNLADMRYCHQLHLIVVIEFILITLISASAIRTGELESSLAIIDKQAMEQSVNDENTVYRPPVIGVLTEVLRDYKRFTKDRHFHIASSYVKWLETSGAQVMPILLNEDDAYYERVFSQTNGLLLPGGDNLLDPHKNTPMMVAAKKLYKLAVEANKRGDHYPIWGTCLGLELLSVLTTNKNVLENCSSKDQSLMMSFKSRGRLFAPAHLFESTPAIDYAQIIMGLLSSKNLTYNHHGKCLTDAGFERAPLLKSFYRPLAYSRNMVGQEFITIFEAIQFPFYGVQFHPEKPSFEFVIKKGQKRIVHSWDAIAVSRYFGDFFVKSAQLSNHKAADTDALKMELIYAHSPMYTALKKDMYEQRYLFPYKDKAGITTEEFLDYYPDEGEEAPEMVKQEVELKSCSSDLERSADKDGLVASEDYFNCIEQLISQKRYEKHPKNSKLVR